MNILKCFESKKSILRDNCITILLFTVLIWTEILKLSFAFKFFLEFNILMNITNIKNNSMCLC